MIAWRRSDASAHVAPAQIAPLGTTAPQRARDSRRSTFNARVRAYRSGHVSATSDVLVPAPVANRLLIVSAMAKDSVAIAFGAGGSRGTQAWNELTAIGEDLGGVMTYATATRR